MVPSAKRQESYTALESDRFSGYFETGLWKTSDYTIAGFVATTVKYIV